MQEVADKLSRRIACKAKNRARHCSILGANHRVLNICGELFSLFYTTVMFDEHKI
jgi:hypothetical protein